MDNLIEKSELRILHSLINKKGMQNIVDTAAEVFGNPLFISDPGYKIICCSDNEGICDDFWEQVKNGKHSEPAFISQIIQSGDFDKVYRNDAPRIGKYPFADKPFLAARITDHGHILGHICVYGLNRLFTEDDKLLLRILSKTVSYEMLYEGMSEKYQMPYYNLFVDLIEGTLNDGRIVEENLKHLGVRLPDKFYLVLVELQNSAAQSAGIYIRDHLLRRLPHTYGIVYKGNLVLLVPGEVLEGHMLEDSLKSYEPAIDYKVGISLQVQETGKLCVYFMQAQEAVEISELLKLEDRYCLYSRLRIYQILLSAGRDMDLRYLCDPVVLQIDEYDKKNHTTYLDDLEVYLTCSRNINKAAEKRCVHKNSMYYRISRIEEKFQISFDEEEIWFSVLLSIKILRIAANSEK